MQQNHSLVNGYPGTQVPRPSLSARQRFWLDLKGWYVLPAVLTAAKIERYKAEVLAGATDAYDGRLTEHPAVTGALADVLTEPPFAGHAVDRCEWSMGPAEYSTAGSSALNDSLPFRCENSFVVHRRVGNIVLGGTNQTVGTHPHEGPHGHVRGHIMGWSA